MRSWLAVASGRASSSASSVRASTPPTLPDSHRSSIFCDESHCNKLLTPPRPRHRSSAPSAHPISAATGNTLRVSSKRSTRRSAMSCRSSVYWSRSCLEAAASRCMRFTRRLNTWGGPSLTAPIPPCCRRHGKETRGTDPRMIQPLCQTLLV
eukprot:09818_1